MARQLWPVFQGIGSDGAYLVLPSMESRELQFHFYRFLLREKAPSFMGRAGWEEAPLWDEGGPPNPALSLSSAATEWLSGRAGVPVGEERLSILPLSIGGFNLAFLLTPAPHLAGSFSTLLLLLYKRIAARFPTERLQQLEHVHQFTQAFFEEACHLLMPPAYKSPGQSVWVPFCRQLYQSPTTYEYALNLGESAGYLKACPSAGWETERLKEEIEYLYQELFEKWELCNRKELLVAKGIQRLSDELEASRNVMDNLANRQQQQLEELGNLKRLSEQLSAPGAASSFEFYRGTDKWSIRFDGKPVKMKNRYTLGLIYIHQLLLNPRKEIHCHQLYLRSGKDLGQASKIWQEIEGHFGKKGLPDDEKGWLDSIGRIEARLEEAPVEAAVTLLEYLVFLAEQLYRTHTSRPNLARLAEFRRRLKAKRLEAEPGQLDERFYKKEITLTGILYKETGQDKEHRRMYQNVTKAIHRTIKTMSLPEARDYFRQALSIGVRCGYFPEKAEIPPPGWKLWMD